MSDEVDPSQSAALKSVMDAFDWVYTWRHCQLEP